jgi:ATP-dependent DNA helicase RecG
VELVDVDGRAVAVIEVPALPRDRRPCHVSTRAPWDSSFIRMADVTTN